ncbi:MAG: hypothetical protein U0903_14140 [Planctomycetales bacterium]
MRRTSALYVQPAVASLFLPLRAAARPPDSARQPDGGFSGDGLSPRTASIPSRFTAPAAGTSGFHPPVHDVVRVRQFDVRSTATFGAIYAIFGEDQKLFNTGWFVESTLTGLMILLVIRTQAPPVPHEPPGTLFLIAEAGVAALTLWIPASSSRVRWAL